MHHKIVSPQLILVDNTFCDSYSSNKSFLYFHHQLLAEIFKYVYSYQTNSLYLVQGSEQR